MQSQIPHFKYRSSTPSSKHSGCIEMEGKLVHEIKDVKEFHKAFGYTPEKAKAGILPDEFLWEEFVHGTASNCLACFQMQLIEYLLKHSVPFKSKYGAQCKDWVVAHSERKATNPECSSCKRNVPQNIIPECT